MSFLTFSLNPLRLSIKHDPSIPFSKPAIYRLVSPLPSLSPLNPISPATNPHPPNTTASFGMTWVFVTTTAYLTESTPNNPATLVALAGLFRNPAAAIAAVVVEPLVGDLGGTGRRRGTGPMGPGWFFTGLALLQLACVGSSLWLMIRKRKGTVGKGSI